MPTETALAPKLIFRLVILLIVGWGLYLCIGAFIRQPARAAVLAICFAGFLGVWWGVWKLRVRRLAKEKQGRSEL